MKQCVPYKTKDNFGIMCCNFDHKVELCSSCGYIGENLCDFPIGNDKTCDFIMCDECSTSVRGELHYCPSHAVEWGKILYIQAMQSDGGGI